MKVAITNAVLSNTGDAAICQSILHSLATFGLAEPEDVVVFDADARATSHFYPEWRVHQQLTVSPPRRVARLRVKLQWVRLQLVRFVGTRPALTRWLPRMPLLDRTTFCRSLVALTEVDIVISTGGTYLVDHYNFGPRVVELELAKRSGAVVVLWTQSMGPFTSARARSHIEAIAPTVDAVYLRDDRSARSWATVGHRSAASAVAPDSVFALADPAAGGCRHPLEPPRAFVSVREWTRGLDGADLHGRGYEQMMRAGARHLLEGGSDVEAISTCQGSPRYAFDDSKIARQIFHDLPVDINETFHTPTQLLASLGGADLVITTRMHLAILAMIARTPVIAVAYEFKTVDLFEGVGLGDLVIPIDDSDDEWLVHRIGLVKADPSSAILSEAHLDDLRERAMTPARDLHRRVTSAGSSTTRL